MPKMGIFGLFFFELASRTGNWKKIPLTGAARAAGGGALEIPLSDFWSGCHPAPLGGPLGRGLLVSIFQTGRSPADVAKVPCSDSSFCKTHVGGMPVVFLQLVQFRAGGPP